MVISNLACSNNCKLKEYKDGTNGNNLFSIFISSSLIIQANSVELVLYTAILKRLGNPKLKSRFKNGQRGLKKINSINTKLEIHHYLL